MEDQKLINGSSPIHHRYIVINFTSPPPTPNWLRTCCDGADATTQARWSDMLLLTENAITNPDLSADVRCTQPDVERVCLDTTQSGCDVAAFDPIACTTTIGGPWCDGFTAFTMTPYEEVLDARFPGGTGELSTSDITTSGGAYTYGWHYHGMDNYFWGSELFHNLDHIVPGAWSSFDL